MPDDDVLAEQRAFYRARAPEYDDWWLRRGRYDRGEAAAREWERQVATVVAALDAFHPTGDVLELAGGTGWWTQRLARTATRLTVVDSSPEMLERNRERVGRADVECVTADLFEWRPQRTYDVVFFSFWISHVPRGRVASFWALVRACLVPGGRLFLVDNRNDPAPAPDAAPDPFVVRYEPDLHRRRLSDGSEYRVVKVMYEPADLRALVDAEGFDGAFAATRWFVYGSAVRRPTPAAAEALLHDPGSVPAAVPGEE